MFGGCAHSRWSHPGPKNAVWGYWTLGVILLQVAAFSEFRPSFSGVWVVDQSPQGCWLGFLGRLFGASWRLLWSVLGAVLGPLGASLGIFFFAAPDGGLGGPLRAEGLRCQFVLPLSGYSWVLRPFWGPLGLSWGSPGPFRSSLEGLPPGPYWGDIGGS